MRALVVLMSFLTITFALPTRTSKSYILKYCQNAKSGKNKMKILCDYAMGFVGLPYIWGGDDPIKGFDCSGLVIELLQAGGALPSNYDNTAQGLFDKFKKEGLVNKYGPGSLAFFGKDESEIKHVGFLIDSKRMIEAGGGRRTTTDAEVASRQNAYVRIRPISKRTDLVAVIKPYYPDIMTMKMKYGLRTN